MPLPPVNLSGYFWKGFAGEVGKFANELTSTYLNLAVDKYKLNQVMGPVRDFLNEYDQGNVSPDTISRVIAVGVDPTALLQYARQLKSGNAIRRQEAWKGIFDTILEPAAKYNVPPETLKEIAPQLLTEEQKGLLGGTEASKGTLIGFRRTEAGQPDVLTPQAQETLLSLYEPTYQAQQLEISQKAQELETEATEAQLKKFNALRQVIDMASDLMKDYEETLNQLAQKGISPEKVGGVLSQDIGNLLTLLKGALKAVGIEVDFSGTAQDVRNELNRAYTELARQQAQMQQLEMTGREADIEYTRARTQEILQRLEQLDKQATSELRSLPENVRERIMLFMFGSEALPTISEQIDVKKHVGYAGIPRIFAGEFEKDGKFDADKFYTEFAPIADDVMRYLNAAPETARLLYRSLDTLLRDKYGVSLREVDRTNFSKVVEEYWGRDKLQPFSNEEKERFLRRAGIMEEGEGEGEGTISRGGGLEKIIKQAVETLKTLSLQQARDYLRDLQDPNSEIYQDWLRDGLTPEDIKKLHDAVAKELGLGG